MRAPLSAHTFELSRAESRRGVCFAVLEPSSLASSWAAERQITSALDG